MGCEQSKVRHNGLFTGNPNDSMTHGDKAPSKSPSFDVDVDISAPQDRITNHPEGFARRPRGVSPQQPSWMLENSSTDNDANSESSVPQLFRITPTNSAADGENTWRWWVQEVSRNKVTRDGCSRDRLQDVRNRLTCQHGKDSSNVELDLSTCYMEQTAPHVLTKLFTSHVPQVRWVTTLRLDGNYFTSQGFGDMIATMSAVNDRRPILPMLRELYLNNMSLDRAAVTGIASFLFPIDAEKTATQSHLGPLPILAKEYQPARPPRVPLFPSLVMLSLSDNAGMGTAGLANLLRMLIAAHLEPHTLAALDLSRCGIDHTAGRVLQEYVEHVSHCITKGSNPVLVRSLLLLGNDHGINHPRELNAPADMQLAL